MSDSDWSRYVAIGLASLALLTVVFGYGAYSYWLGNLSGYKEAESQEYQTAYAEQTGQRITDCFDGVAAPRECVEKAVKSDHEQQRAEQDLKAQRDMADWAFALLVVSSLGLCVTAIGTVFLAWQVSLTRKAVKDTGDATKAMEEANRIAAEAQRPWLQIEVSNVTIKAYNIENVVHVHAFPDLVIRSTGSRPAINIWRELRLGPIKRFGESDQLQFFENHEAGRGAPVQLINPNGSRSLGIFVSCEVSPKEFMTVQAFRLAISIVYNDGVTGLRRQTAQGVLLGGQYKPNAEIMTDLNPNELINAVPTSSEKLGFPCDTMPLPGSVMT